MTLFRLLMLPLVQFPARFGIAVALLHGGLCKLPAGAVKALVPVISRVRRMCVITVTKFLVSLLLLRCGLLNLKRKQMFHNRLRRLLQCLLCGCQLQKLMTNIINNLSDFDYCCDMSHDQKPTSKVIAPCHNC